MAEVTLEYSALYYLNWWCSRDRRFCSALDGNDEAAKLSALREAATEYRVARNLQLKHDQGLGVARLKPVLDAISARSREEFEGEGLIPAIMSVRDIVSGAYGGADVLSLTTKFLWLRFKHPLIIFDRNAKTALKTPGRDLTDFYSRWREAYDLKRAEIQQACAMLGGVYRFCIDPAANQAEVSRLAGLDWFQERVFDTYLWHTGA